MSICKTKNFYKYLIGLLVLIFLCLFFIKGEYILSFLCLVLLIILLRLEDIREFVIDAKGGFRAKFTIPEDKLKQDIIDNKESPTKQKIVHFQDVEEKVFSKVLSDLKNRYGDDMKTLIHFVYGFPYKPEFVYTPDGIVQTADTIYFIEIKYITNLIFANKIIQKTLAYSRTILENFSHATGDKRLIIKLIIASKAKIDIAKYKTQKGIEIEFYKI
ncbi:MAG: hypothetical protein PHW73_15180 [Atribacterota bacterium]|nr:hypothetical protein [Atribacterota bacterium]